ncbi:adenylate cyclase type 2 [Nephila pilipes]|uniref:adenylate cyclase n=1 Tax=Nephila pilipes TaxID=299642 RepID=A0A8X6N2I6_NEPPI|nr:adenylate cyclase type 2 [Nephila pilipes]
MSTSPLKTASADIAYSSSETCTKELLHRVKGAAYANESLELTVTYLQDAPMLSHCSNYTLLSVTTTRIECWISCLIQCRVAVWQDTSHRSSQSFDQMSHTPEEWLSSSPTSSFRLLHINVICVPEDADLRVTFNDTLNLFSRQLHDPPPHCQYGQAHIFPAVLTITAVSLFLRLSFILKLLLMLIDLVGFALAFTFVRPDLFSATLEEGDGFYKLPLSVYAILFLFVFMLVLLVLDRQSEFTQRADFLWQSKLRVEQDEVETMGSINKILLENILPAHVAQHFLRNDRHTEELYHERYRNVAVMFASIPNYKEFYDETDINKQGLECLRLLNEIICDFDKLLLKPKFSRIEKIKTIGSTYMAAAGLQPGREENGDEGREGHNLLALTEFAIALMSLLDQINRESFQRFRLRVGINNGPVIAGVVGAQKPQYDIWGNTVNVASRMDSCGVMGKIQVTEDTAKILMEHNYECECRGTIYVKGKGNLTTYFVKTQFDKTSDC